ncbi:MAG: OB-fold nucleic acid binding domain-containing protein, partial [Patulibacter sp.]
WLARLSGLAHGLPRHLSQHSGGMVVSTRPLIDCCPVVPAAMEGRQMVMWDKDSCSDAKFLKIDLLGLGMLSSVERCVELVSKRRGKELDLSRIELDDEATFKSIQRAETTGVFQIESRAQMGSLLRTKPESIKDLTVQVALVRPGPIQGGAVNPYIEQRQRQREDPSYVPTYIHPSLEEVLKDTLGTIIFQDQVIEVAMAFAKFSSGQAEGLRRAMSRKRSQDALNAYHQQFVEGAQAADPTVTVELAEQVWQMIQGFAGFGFPKAHGAAFGLLAYQSAWLREHYGPEYVCSLLDEQPMGFYPPDALIHEAQRRGIPVIPPDVAVSQVDCTVTDEGAIQVGLGYVKGVRPDEAAALVAEREQGGPWHDLEDLVRRTSGGTTSLEALAWSGACDGIVGADVPEARRRRAALWRVGAIVPGRRVAAGTQMALGLESTGPAASTALPGMNPWERLIADYETTATTTATHPIGLLRPQLVPHGVRTSEDLTRIRNRETVRVSGLVLARQRPGSAKGVVFLLLEDEFGTINLVLSPPVYAQHRLTARTEPLVVVEGRLERHPRGGGQINVVVRWLRPLDDLVSPAAQAAAARLPQRAPVRAEPGFGEQDAVAAGGGAGGFRQVAPGAMNFGRGRR